MVAVKYKTIAASWILGIALIVLVSPIAQATPEWSTLAITVTGCQRNAQLNGLYVYSGAGSGQTIVFIHSPLYWQGTPFIQWINGLGWVLENGVGGKDAFFGSGELPQSSTDAVVNISIRTNTVPANPINGSVLIKAK